MKFSAIRFSATSYCSILYFSIFLFFYSFIAIPIAHAQLQFGLQSSDISVDMSPETPGAHETVAISVTSFATNLDAATVTWVVNGRKVASGRGLKNISVTTAGVGQKTQIDITINAQEGLITKNLTITPSSVDLIWEAHTYTPPFFKGKPLFSEESLVKWIAIPHIMRNGSEVSPQNLIYTWSQNGTVLGDSSGNGKNGLVLIGGIIPRPMDVSVKVTDPQTGSVAENEIAIAPQDPLVLLYQDDPLYGIRYEHALQGIYNLIQNEVRIATVPYYFATQTRGNPHMTYSWNINSNPIADNLNATEQTFRKGNAVGNAAIGVSVTEDQTVFQHDIRAGLIIQFGK